MPTPHRTDACALARRTFAYLAARHTLLQVQTSGFSCDTTGSSIPLLVSATDPRQLLTAAIALPIGALAAASTIGVLRRWLRPPAKASDPREDGLGGVWFALVLLIAPFLPASNLPFHVGFVLAERVLYTPSAGMCALAALGLHAATSSVAAVKSKSGASGGGGGLGLAGMSTPTLRAMSVGVVAVYASAAVRRNGAWATHKTLFRSAVAAYPENVEMHRALAATLTNFADSDTEREEAVELYATAMRIDRRDGRPTPPRVIFNLGVAQMGLGRLDEAESSYRQAVRSSPTSNRASRASGEVSTDAFARYNLGLILMQRAEGASAEPDRAAPLNEALDLFGQAYHIIGGRAAADQHAALLGHGCGELARLLGQAETRGDGMFLKALIIALMEKRRCED